MSDRPKAASSSVLWRYLVAVVSCLLFLLLKLGLRQYLGDTVPFVLFFSAVMISAWFGGLGPGIVATALCTVFAAAYFLGQNLSFWAKVWPLVTFAAEGVSISILSHSRRRVLQNERAAREQAEKVGHKLNEALKSITIEMTQRERSDESLRASEARRRLALDSAELGEWHLDPATMVLTTDERFRTIFGVTADRLDYEQVMAILHPDDRARALEAIAAASRTDSPAPHAIEHRVVHPDGSVRWVFAKGRANVMQAGPGPKILSFDGTVADVTESKLAEEQRLRLAAEAAKQSRVFDTALSSIADFAYILDRDARFLYANKALLNLWGLTLDDALGKNFFELKYPDELAEKLARQIREVFDTKRGLSDETPYTSPTGTSGYYEYILSPVFAADGAVEVVVGSTRDVTGRKRSEEQLRQIAAEREGLLSSERTARSEAERASRMKDEFLATLSHELRTPLNAILGWSQILVGQGRTDQDLTEGLAAIERNARVQTQIIEDLLDMSRIISGKVRIDVQFVDLASVVRAAADTLKPAADAKGVRFQLVLDPGAGPVNGDPNRLQQVFWNLLNNAIKFTPRGGRVQVLLECVNSRLQLSVIDTGEGISAEFLPFVFDRFRQSDASTTRRHGGLGLGLAIVKQLVELHGGNVLARSPGAGNGATFVVSLPLAVMRTEPAPSAGHRHAESTGIPVPSDACVDIAGVKVLVVDDEPDARGFLKRLLEECSAVVIVASSAQEAVERVKTDRPDVIASDIGMPTEDGYSLIRRVRALSPQEGGETPALALTAYARAEDRVKAVTAGFQNHVSKPVEPAELIAMVASLAGRNRSKV